MRKLLSAVMISVILVTTTFSLCPHAEANPTFTLQPDSACHLCRINCYDPIATFNSRAPGPFYPYVGGFGCFPDFSMRYWGVNKLCITASFAGTNPGVIGTNNWLAAGMFLEGMDHVTGGQDYGYYDVIVVDSQGNFYLDVGAWKENDALQYHIFDIIYTLGLVFDRCWLIGGLNYQTPITLNTYWNPDATPSNAVLSWSVTINGQTINPPSNSFNMSAAVPGSAPIPSFYVGRLNGTCLFYCGNVTISNSES